jgi:signal transduction histidine kinase
MCTETITDILGRTVEATRNSNTNERTITLADDEHDLLMQAHKSIKKAGTEGIHTINSILTSLKSSVVGDEKKVYLIKECINRARDDYILLNSSVKDIEVDIKYNFKVRCSLHYLTHVLLNLLKNAYKHGGQDVKIKIWTRRACLYFKDYGRGIPKANLPCIFDRFYTGNKTGAGIGLAFCKMVMEDLGGNIECKSKYGKYTEFKLIFPKSIR